MVRNASKIFRNRMEKKISFSYLIIEIFPRARDGMGGWLSQTLIFAVRMRNLRAMETSPGEGKTWVSLRCERGQVVRGKIYKGQIYIKYDASNTYI